MSIIFVCDKCGKQTTDHNAIVRMDNGNLYPPAHYCTTCWKEYRKLEKKFRSCPLTGNRFELDIIIPDMIDGEICD